MPRRIRTKSSFFRKPACLPQGEDAGFVFFNFILVAALFNWLKSIGILLSIEWLKANTERLKMYIPPAFEVTDTAQIREAISANSFAILISKDGNSFFASHLPFLFKPDFGPKGKLISHMARANRHWQLLNEEEEALIIFNGPHAYISPNWYVTEVAVPTWNYATIHVYGRPKIMQTEGELNAVLDETVEKHEAGLPRPWIPNLSDELKANLHQAIVGFEIEITRIQGKFKFG